MYPFLVIWLSGPTGSGKSSISRALGACGFSIVAETLATDLLSAFVRNPVAGCDALQRSIMSSRLQGWTEVSASPRIVFDRSVDEDAEVFCKMHETAGFLSRKQYDDLQSFANVLQEQLPKPDLIVYLSAEVETLRSRLERAAAPPATLENLSHQISLYSEWIDTRDGEIVKVDTTRLRAETITKFLLEIRSC